MTEAERK